MKSVKLELKKLSEHKTKGAILRSRVRWYEHDERKNKNFINLEKRRYKRKHIVKLIEGILLLARGVSKTLGQGPDKRIGCLQMQCNTFFC